MRLLRRSQHPGIELFPTETRGTAVGVATSVSRIGTAVGTYLLAFAWAPEDGKASRCRIGRLPAPGGPAEGIDTRKVTAYCWLLPSDSQVSFVQRGETG
jgi:hypothetical protein